MPRTSFFVAMIGSTTFRGMVWQAWPDQELVVAVEESQRRNNQWVSLPLDNNCQVQQEMHDAYRQLYGHEAEDVDSLIAAPMPRGGVRCEVLGDM